MTAELTKEQLTKKLDEVALRIPNGTAKLLSAHIDALASKLAAAQAKLAAIEGAGDVAYWRGIMYRVTMAPAGASDHLSSEQAAQMIAARVAELEAAAKQKDERIAELERQRDDARALGNRLSTTCVEAISRAGVSTPEEGYLSVPSFIASDVGEIAKERDALRTRLADVERAIKPLADWVATWIEDPEYLKSRGDDNWYSRWYVDGEARHLTYGDLRRIVALTSPAPSPDQPPSPIEQTGQQLEPERPEFRCPDCGGKRIRTIESLPPVSKCDDCKHEWPSDVAAQTATPAAVEAQRETVDEPTELWRVMWTDSTGNHTSGESFPNEAAACRWAKGALHAWVNWSTIREAAPQPAAEVQPATDDEGYKHIPLERAGKFVGRFVPEGKMASDHSGEVNEMVEGVSGEEWFLEGANYDNEFYPTEVWEDESVAEENAEENGHVIVKVRPSADFAQLQRQLAAANERAEKAEAGAAAMIDVLNRRWESVKGVIKRGQSWTCTDGFARSIDNQSWHRFLGEEKTLRELLTVELVSVSPAALSACERTVG